MSPLKKQQDKHVLVGHDRISFAIHGKQEFLGYFAFKDRFEEPKCEEALEIDEHLIYGAKLGFAYGQILLHRSEHVPIVLPPKPLHGLEIECAIGGYERVWQVKESGFYDM